MSLAEQAAQTPLPALIPARVSMMGGGGVYRLIPIFLDEWILTHHVFVVSSQDVALFF